MPLALGQLVRLLDGPSGQSPWPLLFVYVGLRFLQGSGGLAAVRDVCPPCLCSLVCSLNILSVSVGARYAIFRQR